MKHIMINIVNNTVIRNPKAIPTKNFGRNHKDTRKGKEELGKSGLASLLELRAAFAWISIG